MRHWWWFHTERCIQYASIQVFLTVRDNVQLNEQQSGKHEDGLGDSWCRQCVPLVILERGVCCIQLYHWFTGTKCYRRRQHGLMNTEQIQNYAPLSLKPYYKERVGKPSYYYFEPQHLPHFVNSAEWNLASTITSYPSINFVLYVPSAQEAPLRIHDSKGNSDTPSNRLAYTDIQAQGNHCWLAPSWSLVGAASLSRIHPKQQQKSILSPRRIFSPSWRFSSLSWEAWLVSTI